MTTRVSLRNVCAPGGWVGKINSTRLLHACWTGFRHPLGILDDDPHLTESSMFRWLAI
jgi:hypothetical protein